MVRFALGALMVVILAACGGTQGASPGSTLGAPVTLPPATQALPTVRPATTPRPTPLATVAPTSAARQDIEVVEAGFSVRDDEAYYGIVLRNPNAKGWVATYVTVTIALYDDDGDVVQTEEELIGQALPGQDFAVGGSTFDARGAKKLDVDVTVDEWEEVDYEVGAFLPTKVRLKHSEYESSVTGVLKCTFDTEPQDVEVVAVLRNGAGKIIAGAHDYIEKVRCDKGSAFSIDAFERFGKAKKASVYANF